MGFLYFAFLQPCVVEYCYAAFVTIVLVPRYLFHQAHIVNLYPTAGDIYIYIYIYIFIYLFIYKGMLYYRRDSFSPGLPFSNSVICVP